jgi:hypothetical protein
VGPYAAQGGEDGVHELRLFVVFVSVSVLKRYPGQIAGAFSQLSGKTLQIS